MNNNTIVRSFWMGGALSNLEQLSIYSYLANGHRFEIFTYDSSLQLPKDVVKRDAREIIPANKLFLDSRGSYASFADWFRFKMLFKLGGWWTDLDSVCLKFMDVANEYSFSSEGIEESYLVNIGNIKAPKRAAFLDECLHEIDLLLAKGDNSWGKYGLNLIRKVLSSYDYEEYLHTPKYFCPIHYKDVSNLVSENAPKIPQEAYAIHLWNGMWNFRNLDKNAVYAENSLFESLKRKYLPDYYVTINR